MSATVLWVQGDESLGRLAVRSMLVERLTMQTAERRSRANEDGCRPC